MHCRTAGSRYRTREGSQVCERDGVESTSNGVADPRPQVLCRAAIKSVTDDAHLTLSSAYHRRYRTFERANNLPHRDLVGWPAEAIAAVCATCRLYELLLAKAFD